LIGNCHRSGENVYQINILEELFSLIIILFLSCWTNCIVFIPFDLIFKCIQRKLIGYELSTDLHSVWNIPPISIRLPNDVKSFSSKINGTL
jgi:hypothetical protein